METTNVHACAHENIQKKRGRKKEKKKHTHTPWGGWIVMLSGADRPAGSCVRGSPGRVFTRSGQIAAEQTALCSALTHMTDWVGPQHTHTHTHTHTHMQAHSYLSTNGTLTCKYHRHTCSDTHTFGEQEDSARLFPAKCLLDAHEANKERVKRARCMVGWQLMRAKLCRSSSELFFSTQELQRGKPVCFHDENV